MSGEVTTGTDDYGQTLFADTKVAMLKRSYAKKEMGWFIKPILQYY